MVCCGTAASRSNQRTMALRFAQSLGICEMSKGGRCTMPAQPTMEVAIKTIKSLFITVPMFDFAVVHCFVLFHFGLERSVATVQLHRTAALSGQLYSEG